MEAQTYEQEITNPVILHVVPCGQHQLPPLHKESPVGQQPVSPELLSTQIYPSGQSGSHPMGQHTSLSFRFDERFR